MLYITLVQDLLYSTFLYKFGQILIIDGTVILYTSDVCENPKGHNSVQTFLIMLIIKLVQDLYTKFLCKFGNYKMQQLSYKLYTQLLKRISKGHNFKLMIIIEL